MKTKEITISSRNVENGNILGRVIKNRNPLSLTEEVCASKDKLFVTLGSPLLLNKARELFKEYLNLEISKHRAEILRLEKIRQGL